MRKTVIRRARRSVLGAAAVLNARATRPRPGAQRASAVLFRCACRPAFANDQIDDAWSEPGVNDHSCREKRWMYPWKRTVRDRSAQGISSSPRHAKNSVGELDALMAVDGRRKKPYSVFGQNPPEHRNRNGKTNCCGDGADDDVEEPRPFDPTTIEHPQRLISFAYFVALGGGQSPCRHHEGIKSFLATDGRPGSASSSGMNNPRRAA
jgi:hypothetical protein